MSDNDNVVRPDAFQPQPDTVETSVRQVLGFISDHARSARGIAVAIVDDEGNLYRDMSLSDDPYALYTAIGLLLHRMGALVEESTRDEPDAG